MVAPYKLNTLHNMIRSVISYRKFLLPIFSCQKKGLNKYVKEKGIISINISLNSAQLDVLREISKCCSVNCMLNIAI